MLQLGTSTDMVVLALVSFAIAAWPAVLTGLIIGWRFLMGSGAIEITVVSFVGAVLAVAWELLSGFALLLGDGSMTVIMIGGYFAGVIIGLCAKYIARTIRSRRTAS